MRWMIAVPAFALSCGGGMDEPPVCPTGDCTLPGRTIVLYESPHRAARTLADLGAAFGASRRISVARELTKLHEELRVGTLAELADYYSGTPPRGELTIVMEGSGTPPAAPDRTTDAVEEATALLAEGLTRREVARRLTETLGLSRNDAYRLVTGLP